ncbi:MAG TPA: FtsK/SpoIIIE domain-containing protein [Acidimicrobiales bacterium]|nr:FtsK/SpoIIIE domain-containing protein [Acidimicrobiales bacterium]
MTTPVRAPLWACAWHWMRNWAVEILVTVLAAWVLTFIGDFVGGATVQVLFVLATTTALLAPRSRAVLATHLGQRARKRRWKEALRIAVPPPGAPWLLRYREDDCGAWADVRTGPGGTVTQLESRSEAIAAWLAVHDIRIQRHPTSAGHACLRALRSDPLDADPGRWPWMDRGSTDLWEPVPVGRDETGNEVSIGLAGHNLLIGGEPGAGKSVALAQIVAAAALDRQTQLFLLDGKLVELAAWRDVANGHAGTDIHEAIDLLAGVQAEMEARYHQLLRDGLRKIIPGSALSLVVIDELAHYATWLERKARDRFCDLLRDLVSRGRAAGVIVVAATQKPGSDIIPTSLRDLFGYRWALRCTTPAASDTILGAGWASSNITSHTIAANQRGVGWLHYEAAQPTRLKAHHLTDVDLQVLASRALGLRKAI